MDECDGPGSCQADRRPVGARRTVSVRPSAEARRSSSGRVGVVPPTSNPAMPGWVIPARSASWRCGQPQFLAAQPDRLGQLKAQPGGLIGLGHAGAIDAGRSGFGEPGASSRAIGHRHPSSSSSEVWASRWQRAIAAAALAISAVSPIFRTD